MIVALWIVIAAGVSVCAVFMVVIALQGRQAERAMTTQLNGLAETHKQGVEVMLFEVDRIKARIHALETVRGRL